MKEETVTKYKCEICGAVYGKEDEARACEDRQPVNPKGVVAGDTVRITNGGPGNGEVGKVEDTWYAKKDWGHYAWKTYWHTTVVQFKSPNGGSRILTFDAYDVVDKVTNEHGKS